LLAGCGLTLPLNLRTDKTKRITAVAGQGRVERWPASDPLLAPPTPNKTTPAPTPPGWQHGAVVQDAYDHYKIYKLAEPAGRPVVVDEGARSAGWIDISDDTWGCAAGIVAMAENYPTALEVSNKDATLTAWLYPPQVAPLDLRRYAATAAESDSQFPPGKATGISKTH
jgi:hypothetical protein